MTLEMNKNMVVVVVVVVVQMKMIERRRVQTCVHCTVAHWAKASKASSSRPKGRLAFVHSNISIASNNLKMHCHEQTQTNIFQKQTFLTNKQRPDLL